VSAACHNSTTEGVSDSTRALRRRRDAHTVVTAATHARDGEQHGHVLKSRQLQVVAERHTIQWEGLRQQSTAIKTTFWGLLQPVGPLGRRWRCFGGWACTLECPRCVASGPTTENVPPKTFLRTPIAKTFASRGGGVGLHEVASPRARAEMRRTAFSAELKRRPTQADTGSSTCTAHRLCSRRRQHGHDGDQGASTATTTTTTTTITPPRAKTAAAASRVKASLMPTTRFNLFEKIFIC
jgi:hypothetical protein